MAFGVPKQSDARRRVLRGLVAGTVAGLVAPAALADTDTRQLDIVVFSYLDRPIFDITVGAIDAGTAGPYPYSGRRSKVGVRVPVGPQRVSWRLGGEEGQPGTGDVVAGKNAPTIYEFPRDARFLAIHIYPDYAIELAFSPRHPKLSKRGAEIDAAFQKNRAQ